MRYIRGMQILHERAEDQSAYPFCLPVIGHIKSLSFSAPVTIFVGENGTGKSTLLEAIAIASGFNAEGGTKNFRFETAPTNTALSGAIRLLREPKMPRDGFFLRAESFFNVATQIDEVGYEQHYGGKSLHEVSHGESFLRTALNRFSGHGLYLLDEPEAALSPTGQFALLAHMRHLAEALDSQFIIATHSPLIMAYPGACIYELREDGAHITAYEETDHYILYKAFLSNPRMREQIFSDDEQR